MTRPVFFLLSLLVLTSLGSFLKILLGVAGVPNIVPVLRDPLLLLVCLLGVSKLDFFKTRKWQVLILLLTIFSAIYVFSSLLEDRTVVGLYYLRFYFLPFLFFLGALGIMTMDTSIIRNRILFRFLLWWNALLFVIALTIYVVLQVVPTLRPTFFGNDLLPTAWYISGGVWMRMGLPASGPNTLGLLFALNAFVFCSLLILKKTKGSEIIASTSAVFVGVFISLIGLMLTFSRSSMLILILALPLFMLMPGVLNFSRFFKLSVVISTLLALIVFAGVAADIASDGYVSRWVELNMSMKDPSMLGHLRSITDAIDKFYEYALWGYPRGTVGPKAIIFTGVANNVENSLLAIVYDMGLMLSAVFIFATVLLYSFGYTNRVQLILLGAFAAPCMLLPYVFEPDALIYFAFIYLLLGCLHQPDISPASSYIKYVRPSHVTREFA